MTLLNDVEEIFTYHSLVALKHLSPILCSCYLEELGYARHILLCWLPAGRAYVTRKNFIYVACRSMGYY